ncbi:MAG: DUF1667 domain-containing protein [Monoglobales bacterium]
MLIYGYDWSCKSVLVACRSNKPLPNDKIFCCMDEIRKLSVKAPVKRGDILIADILGTGADIIATADAI